MKIKSKIDVFSQYELWKILSYKLKIIVFIFGVLIVLLSSIDIFSHQSIRLALMFIGIVAIFVTIFWNKIIYRRSMNRFSRSFLINAPTFNYYELNEDHLKASTFQKEKELGSSTIKYEHIYKVVENKNYIFVFISPKEAWPISKSGILEDTLVKLTSFLRGKVNNYLKVKR